MLTSIKSYHELQLIVLDPLSDVYVTKVLATQLVEEIESGPLKRSGNNSSFILISLERPATTGLVSSNRV